MQGKVLNIIRPQEWNWIENPQFKINQRGDFETSPVAIDGTYTFLSDRYAFQRDSGATTNGSMQLFKESTRIGAGLKNYGGYVCRISNTAVQPGRVFGSTRLEWVEQFKGRTIIIAVKARDVDSAGNCRLAFWDGSTIDSVEVPSDGNFHTVQLKIVVPETATFIAPFFGIMGADGGAVTGNMAIQSMEIAQVSVFTDIEQAPMQFIPRMDSVELLLCKRYYQRLTNKGGLNNMIGSGRLVSTSRGLFIYNLEVEMRALPSFKHSSFSDFTIYYRGGSDVVQTTFGIRSVNETVVELDCPSQAGGLPSTIGAAFIGWTSGVSQDSYIAFESEL